MVPDRHRRRLDSQMGAVVSKQTWRYVCRDKEVSKEERPYVIKAGVDRRDRRADDRGRRDQTGRQGRHHRSSRDHAHPGGDGAASTRRADWINPAQNSPTLIIIWPMHVDDVKAMMKDDDKNPTPGGRSPTRRSPAPTTPSRR
jgi:hypothetical protein